MTSTATHKHVHPFPARMAPELDKIEVLTNPGATVLDPMCGSGTVVRLAAESKRVGIGADLDPLAVMITRTACHNSWATDLAARAGDIGVRAWRLGGQLPEWIRKDRETAVWVSTSFRRPEPQARTAHLRVDGFAL